MPLLQVRNFPKDLYELLAETARSENRSIAQETVYLIKTILNFREERKVRRKNTVDRILQKRVENSEKFPDPSVLIREDRTR